MTQEILILILFILACGFVGRKIYREFKAENGCPKGCGNCEVSNVESTQMSSSIKSIK